MMQLGLRGSAPKDWTADRGSLRSLPWSTLWRGGVLALCIVLVLSTQLLFQVDLYRHWPLNDILLGWVDHLVDQLIVGGSMFAAIAMASVIPVQAPIGRHTLVLTAIALGALVGEAMNTFRVPLPSDVSTAAVLFAKSVRWMVIGALAYAFFVYQRQAEHASALAHENELHSVQLELQMTQARLQSLRAYIEPHFLFNTLANIRQLYRVEPDRGRAMLVNFIAYVRAALPRMQRDRTTLGQDVDLARAYLGVLHVRMGERLHVHFDVPEHLLGLPFPPLALSTLAENAVKHGVNPLPEGGAITISARLADGHLSVDVADTGAGLRASSGTGSGLANLRARLAALYGNSASLTLRSNDPRGIRAIILVPLEAHAATRV
jgi:hypothetical protein